MWLILSSFNFRLIPFGSGYPRVLFATAKPGSVFYQLTEKHFPNQDFGADDMLSSDRIHLLMNSQEKLTVLDIQESNTNA